MPKGIADYQLMYNLLKAKIYIGEDAVGDELPTEPELAEQFNVDRGVLRPTLKILEEEGRISCQLGRGAFVRANDKTPEIRSLTQQISDSGMQPSTKLVGDGATARLITAGEAPDFVVAACELDSRSPARTVDPPGSIAVRR